ncbi:MAG TPA: energy-coupling factor ABC transporter permease [Candidatus Eisenbacteria bacterium]|jgi:cobalt/nickel transport system permease protein
MHVPDGFLDARTALAAGGLAAAGVGLALKVVGRTLPPSRAPLIGVASAFVFAAQMLNFPVAGGTSGHLIGAVLAAVLLGPSAAVIAMTSVLTLQCFLFADGGVTALGANLFNMAVVAPTVGYGVYRVTARAMGDTARARLVGTAFGAWCSTVVAAIACAGELALSGTVPWGMAFPAMTGVHMLIGTGEALITTLVVGAVARARPELLAPEAGTERDHAAPADRRRAGHGELAGYGILVSLGLAIFVAPFASRWPDGLERVLSSLGVAPSADRTPSVPSPLPDYAVPGVPSAVLSTVLAGFIGTLVAFLLAYLLARSLTPRRVTGPRGGL